MPELNFKTISFLEKDDCLQVNLLKIFYTKIPQEEIGKYRLIDSHTIQFDNDKTKKKIFILLSKYFINLKNKLTGNPATYIHRNSGLPLIGNVALGIVYRNSSIIEIKPVTSCNLNCIYCSISEGLASKKHDFVVEKDYLVEELAKLIDFIAEPVEVHIGVQGEPFLYADIEELINDLQGMDKVSAISIDTNGTLLTTELIDRLARHNKLQLNFSLDSLNPEKAQKFAGTKTYNVNYIKKMITYASERLNVIVAPVLVPGYNDLDIEEIIKFVSSLKKPPLLGIQNYLRYKTGRTPAKELPWKKFYSWLNELEKKYKIKLRWSKEDFNIRKTKDLPKPFKEGEVVHAIIKCPDRFPETCIAATKDRNISISNCMFRAEKKVKVKILKDKHNIFAGKLV